MVELQNPGINGPRRSNAPREIPYLTHQSLPIVWAIDAFPDHSDHQLRTAEIIQKLYPLSAVYPVYVLSEESFSDTGFTSGLRPTLRPMAKKVIAGLLTDVKIHDLRKPRVLFEASSSRTACAKRLVRFARKIGAGMIALSSHGRKGLSKLLLGSFSEAVLNHSRLPILINGPHFVGLDRKPSVVIYPTDFSEACLAAYPQVIELCLRFGAELHLFHKVIHPMDPIVQSGVHMLGGGWVSVEAYFNQPYDDHHSDAEAWVNRAKAAGIATRFIPENYREPTSEAIVDYVSKLQQASALVAMVSQTGPITSALFGSVAREVIRLSPAPVHVIPRIETAESQP